MNRRQLAMMAGGGALAGGLVGVGGCTAGGAGGAGSRELTPLESANEQLVDAFVRDYAKLDVNLLASYMHEDIIYQVSENQPEVVGVDAYIKRNGAMFEGLERIDWRVLRSCVIGQLVINERVDDFFPKPGSRIPRMSFTVSGFFLIVDNKIKVWRDYGYPGAKQVVVPAGAG